MQPEKNLRMDTSDLKAQLFKKVGSERFKKYFYCLNRFLDQKLSKSEFDKSCNRLLGRENLPLHNQIIKLILKNACTAKSPPPTVEAGPTKDDRHGHEGSVGPPIWSNGLKPSGLRDSIDENNVSFFEENHRRLKLSKRSHITAPLGIPFCSASTGGARKALPVSLIGDYSSCFESAHLSDSETLKRRMEDITQSQGIGGVTLECANTMNKMVDVYLKRLIKSCVELVCTRNQRVPYAVSLLDFKVAMELNPRELGEDWPLLFEKISTQAFEE